MAYFNKNSSISYQFFISLYIIVSYHLLKVSPLPLKIGLIWMINYMANLIFNHIHLGLSDFNNMSQKTFFNSFSMCFIKYLKINISIPN